LQYASYDFPVSKAVSVYNQFAFSGARNLNAGLFYNYNVNNFCLFGEFAQTAGSGRALVTGAIGSLTSRFDFAILVRHFDRNYHSFYANPFSENSKPQNETGVYWGVKYKWNRRLSFAGYVDVFRFPWLSFRRYAPSEGYEWLARITFQPSRKVQIFAQMRHENKARNRSEESVQYIIAKGQKTNLWASMNYAEGPMRIRTRIQYSTFHFAENKSNGIVLLQGVGFEFGKFQVTGHYALFQTDDFDNRQYVYENDVYLAFSLPSYDGTGVRSMVMIEYKMSKRCALYLRYAKAHYRDKSEIGSGLEKIEGNVKNDVKFQAVLRF
jgi:hypothetical protein